MTLYSSEAVSIQLSSVSVQQYLLAGTEKWQYLSVPVYYVLTEIHASSHLRKGKTKKPHKNVLCLFDRFFFQLYDFYQANCRFK